MEIIPNSALILVCILPRVRDFEITRMLGWYRIPLKSAPKIIDVDFLAFYQGSNFSEGHRCQIEYFAEYHGHELTTRRELLRDEPEHPHANEEYYKIQIGTLQRCQPPILADKWKRITFLYTLGDLFNHAKRVNDLVVQSAAREGLWQALRERNPSTPLYHVLPPAISEFDESLLLNLFTGESNENVIDPEDF